MGVQASNVLCPTEVDGDHLIGAKGHLPRVISALILIEWTAPIALSWCLLPIDSLETLLKFLVDLLQS